MNLLRRLAEWWLYRQYHIGYNLAIEKVDRDAQIRRLIRSNYEIMVWGDRIEYLNSKRLSAIHQNSKELLKLIIASL